MVVGGQSVVAEMLRESLQHGGSPRLTVASNSMSPLLRSGDEVTLAPVAPKQLTAGQIITFATTDNQRPLVTHRVAGLTKQNAHPKIATFGDRSLLFDPPVAIEDVIGLVVSRRRNGHSLQLDRGRGARLNKKLMLLATKNLEQVTGLAPGELPVNSDSVHQLNENCRRQRARIGTRVYLRLRYYWAALLISFTSYAAQDRNKP